MTELAWRWTAYFNPFEAVAASSLKLCGHFLNKKSTVGSDAYVGQGGVLASPRDAAPASGSSISDHASIEAITPGPACAQEMCRFSRASVG
jgi:hypothetical protein